MTSVYDPIQFLLTDCVTGYTQKLLSCILIAAVIMMTRESMKVLTKQPLFRSSHPSAFLYNLQAEISFICTRTCVLHVKCTYEPQLVCLLSRHFHLFAVFINRLLFNYPCHPLLNTAVTSLNFFETEYLNNTNKFLSQSTDDEIGQVTVICWADWSWLKIHFWVGGEGNQSFVVLLRHEDWLCSVKVKKPWWFHTSNVSWFRERFSNWAASMD